MAPGSPKVEPFPKRNLTPPTSLVDRRRLLNCLPQLLDRNMREEPRQTGPINRETYSDAEQRKSACE
jgi:hypothetical protein